MTTIAPVSVRPDLIIWYFWLSKTTISSRSHAFIWNARRKKNRNTHLYLLIHLYVFYFVSTILECTTTSRVNKHFLRFCIYGRPVVIYFYIFSFLYSYKIVKTPNTDRVSYIRNSRQLYIIICVGIAVWV